MPRAGDRNGAKEQHWRQVLADWASTGLSIAKYCRQKNIVVSQFYKWQRTIKSRDEEQVTTSRQTMAEKAQRITDKAKRERQRLVEFAEVQVVNDKPPAQAKPNASASGCLEVVFASGTKVRLEAGCSLELFASVVDLLENR